MGVRLVPRVLGKLRDAESGEEVLRNQMATSFMNRSEVESGLSLILLIWRSMQETNGRQPKKGQAYIETGMNTKVEEKKMNTPTFCFQVLAPQSGCQ